MVLLGPNFAVKEKHESITLVGCSCRAIENSEMLMTDYALNKEEKEI
jgi:hypothetical protein